MLKIPIPLRNHSGYKVGFISNIKQLTKTNANNIYIIAFKIFCPPIHIITALGYLFNLLFAVLIEAINNMRIVVQVLSIDL